LQREYSYVCRISYRTLPYRGGGVGQSARRFPFAGKSSQSWPPYGRPENHEPVTVELDNKFALKTALRGQDHERLQSCSRCPEKNECRQECPAQINPSPENLERLLQKWYQAKKCAICDRPLGPADWRRSRLALLNEKHKLFELRHMHLEEIPSDLDHMAPLCWNCH
jgi:hypothetical protein